MGAHKDDSQTFYKLIQRQRCIKSQGTNVLKVNEETYTDQELIKGWQAHFEGLSEPMEDENFNPDEKQEIELTKLIIENICRASSDKPIQPFTATEVEQAITSLNKKKAADIEGLAAEHIIHGGEQTRTFINELLNAMVENCHIPDVMKMGLVTPILKKGKNGTDPNNYRGITVLPIVSKILEKLILSRIKNIVRPHQHEQQRGFTENSSSTLAALLVTEAIADAEDEKSEIHIAFLDAHKAFDVVWHDKLFVDLYEHGIEGELWCLLAEQYTDQTSITKWNGMLTEPILSKQGTRQGSSLSAELFKIYTNKTLYMLEESGLGYEVGDVKIGNPTCADDIALVSGSTHNIEGMAKLVEHSVNHNRQKINATKSAYITKNVKTPICEGHLPCINGNSIPICQSAIHLGINRRSIGKIAIDDYINMARRTLYQLMGAGLHGKNGMNPTISINIWKVYIIPRMLYGLEVLKPSKADITALENFQKRTVKQLQHLPDRCADVIALLLIGAEKIESILDKRVIGLYLSICRNSGSIENQLAIRQLATKSLNSKSWFSNVRHLLNKYDLPSANNLMENPPSQYIARKMIRKHVDSYWRINMIAEASKKTSSRFLNLESCNTNKSHTIWTTVTSDVRDVERACVKAKLLTGSYILQANRARFNQNDVDPTCTLCNDAPEDREHFLCICSKFTEERAVCKQKMTEILIKHSKDDLAKKIQSTGGILLKILLDATFLIDDALPEHHAPLTKKKKQFIDKNTAVTFHLVHRSQRDPLQASDEAPQHVLAEDPGSKRKEKLRTYGVYFEDDYDYMQHLHDTNEVSELMEEPVRIPREQSSVTQDAVLQLPSSVFGSQMETTTGLLNKAVPIRGPQVDWDPDIVAAMDEDFDVDDPDNQLEDDFVIQANTEPGPMDGPLDDDDTDSDIASDEADISGSESGNDEYGDDMFMNEETRSRFTNYSLTSSVMRRNEGLTLLDDRFEMLYEQYDETEIGALDHEDIDGCVQEGNLLLDAVLQEYEEAITKVNLSDVLVTSERVEEMTDSGAESDDSQLVKMVIEEHNKWDCESILSTYSNIYNHPRLIEEPRKGDKIKLTSKLSIPVGVLSEPGLTRKQVEKDIQRSRTADRAPTFRPKHESSDDKQTRKVAIKEERKERRQEKKANKLAFKEEKRKQEKQTMDVEKNLKGFKMT